MILLARIFSLIIMCGILPGCGIFSVVAPSTGEPVNVPLPGTTCEDIEDRWNTTGNIVVIASFSGGGKRAAAFAYGVMLGLEDVSLQMRDGTQSTLLQQVDTFAAVSGGTLPAAYYSLNKEALKFKNSWVDFENFLYEGTQGRLFLYALHPTNWLVPLTNVTARYFTERLFPNNTFADLQPTVGKTTKPYLIIGATDVSRAQQFNFTPTQFNCIGSDLSKYPIGHAVAASAAFPLFFGNLNLKNFKFGEKASPYTKARKREKGNFISLSDGGLVDNLAVRVFLNQLNNGKLIGDKSDSARDPAKALIYIRVDGSGHLATRYDDKPRSPWFSARMERSFEVVFEKQIEDIEKQVKLSFSKKLDSLISNNDPGQEGAENEKQNFTYVLIKASLEKASIACLDETDHGESESHTRCSLTKIPTKWSLAEWEIESLITAGKKAITAQPILIETIKKLFKELTP